MTINLSLIQRLVFSYWSKYIKIAIIFNCFMFVFLPLYRWKWEKLKWVLKYCRLIISPVIREGKVSAHAVWGRCLPSLLSLYHSPTILVSVCTHLQVSGGQGPNLSCSLVTSQSKLVRKSEQAVVWCWDAWSLFCLVAHPNSSIHTGDTVRWQISWHQNC